jgi:hypothetical protein
MAGKSIPRVLLLLLSSKWLGGRDSNPDSQIQSLESYHWTTSQQRNLNLRITVHLVNNPQRKIQPQIYADKRRSD